MKMHFYQTYFMHILKLKHFDILQKNVMHICMKLDEILYTKLQELAEQRRITELANRSDIPQSTLSRAISSRQNIGLDKVSRLLEALGAEVTFPDEVRQEYTMIPKVTAVAGAGESLETSDAVAGYYAFRKDFLLRENIHASSSVLLVVRGDSMEPLLRENDLILVDQAENTLSDGRIFLVGLGDALMVKRVQRLPNGWNLCSDNPLRGNTPVEGEDMENLRVYGRVRWYGRIL